MFEKNDEIHDSVGYWIPFACCVVFVIFCLHFGIQDLYWVMNKKSLGREMSYKIICSQGISFRCLVSNAVDIMRIPPSCPIWILDAEEQTWGNWVRTIVHESMQKIKNLVDVDGYF